MVVKIEFVLLFTGGFITQDGRDVEERDRKLSS